MRPLEYNSTKYAVVDFLSELYSLKYTLNQSAQVLGNSGMHT